MKNVFFVLTLMALPVAASAAWNSCGCEETELPRQTGACQQVYNFDVDFDASCLNLDTEQPNLHIDIQAPPASIDVPAPKVELEIEKPRVDLQFSKPQIEMRVTQPKVEYRLKKPCCSCSVSQPRISMFVHETPPCQLRISKPRCSMSCGKACGDFEGSTYKAREIINNDDCGCHGFGY